MAKENEIQLTRIYDATLKEVWDAWTDPDQVAQWWGPRGFSITTHSRDLRTGGHWRYTMHGPDGVDYENKTLYLEVDPHARLVYDHGGSDDRPALFRVTVLFSESQGKTTLDMTMRLATPQAADETRKHIKRVGGNATWDRLGEYLIKRQSGKDAFLINRSFAAPVEQLFEMWTNPEHFAQWLPPTGFQMQFLQTEMRPGGTSVYVMSQGSTKIHGRLHFLHIERPQRIVYTQEFCDEHGSMARHPHAPLWPATMLTTVTLTAERDDETRVTVEWQPYGDAAREELAEFAKTRGSMTLGWTGSFDKLETMLAARNG